MAKDPLGNHTEIPENETLANNMHAEIEDEENDGPTQIINNATDNDINAHIEHQYFNQHTRELHQTATRNTHNNTKHNTEIDHTT